jgi:succinate dehydrogenase / fumarate reductase cytochrome b subunit
MTQGNRPLSPHLQIYRQPLTAILSITHRATGVFLSLGTLMLVCWLTSVAGGAEHYAGVQDFFGSWYMNLMWFLWSVALFYHLCNGIRHLFWDAGYGYDIPTIHASGYGVLIATAILTLSAWLAAGTGG